MATLVCGVGYIGAALAASLITTGEDVIGFDNLFSTDRRALDALVRHGSFKLVEGDVASAADVRRAFDEADIDSVYLLAAQSSANDAAISAEYTELTNLRGPRLVFDQCLERGVETVVLGSSLRVYGQPLPPVVDESTRYGVQRDLSHLSKIYAEKLLEMYAARGLRRAVAARLAIVYGLAPVMKTEPSFMTVPNRFARQARLGETFRLSADAGLLSLLHVDDAVRALRLCLELPADGFRPVNVFGEWCSLPHLAEVVADEASRRGLDVAAPADAEESAEPPTSSSSLSALGFELRRDLVSGIRELIDYYLADVA